MSVLPSTVSGMELWAQEWRNSLFLQYLSIHLTCRTIAMDVDQNFLYSTPSTSRRGDSSQRVTNSSVMGFPTLHSRPSPPRMCVTTPKYTHIAPLVERRTISKGTLQRPRKRWMLWVILYLPRPWLKEGSPHHDASQQAP